MDEAEITDCMADRDIIEARKITKNVEGTRRSTASVILIFSAAKLPDRVHVGYESVSVRPYIPNPLRCFNFMIIMEMLVGLHTPTAVDAPQMRVILQTNVHLLFKSAVTVRVLIPLSRAIAPRGNWKKEICTVKATEGISYYEARMRVKQT